MTADRRADERADVVRRLAAVPDRLAVAARSAAGRSAPAGEWGPPEIVRHLIAVEEVVWHTRLRQLAAADRPTWPWVEPEPWQGDPGATLDDLLAAHAARRGETAAILYGFDEATWSRTGIHATWGEIDVAALMTRAIDHDDEHIASFSEPGPPSVAQ
jgi:DinB superfamily